MEDPILMIEEAWEQDEPVFILRGKDVCAARAIWAYIQDLEAVGASEDHISDCQAILGQFQDYLAANLEGLKIPD